MPKHFNPLLWTKWKEQPVFHYRNFDHLPRIFDKHWCVPPEITHCKNKLLPTSPGKNSSFEQQHFQKCFKIFLKIPGIVGGKGLLWISITVFHSRCVNRDDSVWLCGKFLHPLPQNMISLSAVCNVLVSSQSLAPLIHKIGGLTVCVFPIQCLFPLTVNVLLGKMYSMLLCCVYISLLLFLLLLLT